MSKILANQIANYGDDAPIEIKEGLNIPAGKPIQAAGVSGTSGQVLTSTGSTISWTTPFDGDYNSLSNLPTIPAAQVNSDWNATSGVSRILNKPVIPPLPSVTTNAAGTAALSYNSVNGQFTYTPPDLSNYDTAYGWGDHSTAGYLTAEADTLDTVLARGATTSTHATFNNAITTYGTVECRYQIDIANKFNIGANLQNSDLNMWFNTAGGADLFLNTDSLYIANASKTAYKATFNGSSVQLYYGGAVKLQTTNEGVTITGNNGVNNLQVDGDALVIGGLTAGGLSYPEVTGTAGQILTSDGAGNVVWGSSSGGAGIALTDLSVTTNAAGTAALSYNNISGVFTYTPPDLSGYLTSYTETDPVFSISPAASISTAQINNWNSAYSWGDHSAQGYLTSYTETDTLDTVTGRGYTTSNNIVFNDGVQARFGTLNGTGEGDLRIYHAADGSASVIQEVGGTDLIIMTAGSDIKFRRNNEETFAEFHNNGSVDLYFDNAKKFETTTNGATITGALTAGGLTYPTTNGTSGEVLTSDGAGNVVWGAANSQVTISDTLPAGTPSAGDLWWESDTGRLKIYYQDVDSAQWVDTNPPLADATSIGGSGTVAMRASIIPDTNAAYDIGSAEYKIRDLYLDSGSIHTPSGNNLSFYDGNLTWGGDDVIMLQDLKDMMATATSFEDFKNAIMGL